MNDITTTVSGIIQKIGSAFLLVYYVPSLLFVAIQSYVFIPAWTGIAPTLFGVNIQNINAPSVDLPALIQLLGVSAIVAVLLTGLSSTLIRLFSGKIWWLEHGLLWWPTRVRRQRAQNQYAELDMDRSAYREYVARMMDYGTDRNELLEMLEKLSDQIEAKHEQNETTLANRKPLPKLKAEVLDKALKDLVHYARVKRVAPTAFGTAFTSVIDYAIDHYRIDPSIFWPRLQILMTKEAPELNEALLNSENQMSLSLNLSFLSAVLVVEGAITWITNFWARDAGVTALLALVTFVVFYQASILAAARLAQLMKMAFDQHRHLVLRMFNLPPAPTLQAEHRQWEALTKFIVRAESFYLPHQDIAQTSNDSRNVGK